jgi:hypothetical protein
MSARTPVQVRLFDDELNELDRFRRKHKNLPTRPEAARELLREKLGLRSVDCSSTASPAAQECAP